MKPVEHKCYAIDHSEATIRCVSFTDNASWFNLVWVDGSSLLVKFCPFCGASVKKLNGKNND